MPTRISYSTLKDTLQSIINPIRDVFAASDDSILICCILQAFGVSEDIYKLGRTMIFFKAGQLAFLNRLLNNKSDIDAKDIKTKAESFLRSINEGLQLVTELQSRWTNTSIAVNEVLKDYQSLWNQFLEFERGTKAMTQAVPSDVKKVFQDIDELSKRIDVCIQDMRSKIDATDAIVANKSSPSAANYAELRSKILHQYVSSSKQLPSSPYFEALMQLNELRSSLASDGSVVNKFKDDLESVKRHVLELETGSSKCSKLLLDCQDGAKRCKTMKMKEVIRHFESEYAVVLQKIPIIQAQVKDTLKRYNTIGKCYYSEILRCLLWPVIS